MSKLFRSGAIQQFDGNDGSKITIDPYFVGVLLGDGDTAHSSINITTMDDEIVTVIQEQAEKYSATLRTEPAGKAKTYIFRSGLVGCKAHGGLNDELKALGMYGKTAGTKSVPSYYKTLPIQQRLQVIAGLIDTDGCLYGNSGYDYVSKSEALANDLAFMCRSVGLAAYVKQTVKTAQNDFVGTYWRVSISGECSMIPCRVERRIAGQRKQKKDVLRTGVKSIEPVGIGQYNGFTVDGDNLYLIGDFTVTHNCGKTITFAEIARRAAMHGGRTLVLAHRGELLDQAADKITKLTGLACSREQAESTSLGEWNSVTVGSVQTLMQDKRLAQFSPDRFSYVIVDEAHHAVSDSYRKVLDHFEGARVLGVTATADRADRRGLSEVFDSLAFEYGMADAIHDGWLCPIEAQMIPLKLDISYVGIQSGDYAAGQLGAALEPYLDAIADEMAEICANRKTVVFLPLVKMAKDFADKLNSRGLRACEVDGMSQDRAEILADFQHGRYNVLCNSMLLTEGWDCPEVDCIVCLRPTKSRGLYCLDEKTEVLTRDGWKADVEVGEEVLAFDKETGETRFVPALAKVRRELEPDEFFCSIKGQSCDIRVTNHHRMLYDNKRHTGWKFKEAQDLAQLKDGAYIPVCGSAKFPGVQLTDDEIRFIGWVMTDGTINPKNNQITIAQSKHQPWVEDIQSCIDGCNLKYGKHEITGGTQYNETSPRIIWTISKGKPRGIHKDRRGWGYLEEYISKDLSPALHDMTERQFDVLLETVHQADGAKQANQPWTRRSYHIGKGNKTFIERLQVMALQRGYRSSISLLPAGNQGRKSDFWTLHLKKQNFVKVGSQSGKHSTWEIEPHTDETCWCVQNELGTLVTRRNGKVAIVGNCQMVGRGTRLAEGKTKLLLLDFLWMTGRHDLCRPASLLGVSDEVEDRITEMAEEAMEDGASIDLLDAEPVAESDVQAQREAKLAAELEAMRHRKAKLVDPLQYALSICDLDLSTYEPEFAWERDEPSEKQVKLLESRGIDADGMSAGMASRMIDTLIRRQDEGMATPKQVRMLERKGFKHPGTWSFEDASKMMGILASNRWMVPAWIDPETYVPGQDRQPLEDK